MSYDRRTVPCEICGAPTICTNTKRCNGCYEVESRLAIYMQSPKALDVIREHLPPLDDWTGGKPGWDYEKVLADHGVTVEWGDKLVDGDGNEYPAPPDLCGWGFYWRNGAIHIGQTTETIARKAAALFVSLWLRKVSASFCDKLMDGYICFLERQENTSLTFLVEIDHGMEEGCFRLTREGLFNREPFTFDMEERLAVALNPQPDEEIIVTFTKRKR